MAALIQVVDTNDRPIRVATKQEIWEKGLLHRIVRIMIEHPDGRILLQRRSPTKDIFPNCWDNSAAGHVDAGEEYEAAAYRELKEELGLQLPLQEMGRYGKSGSWREYTMNRFHCVYKAVTDRLPTALEAGKVDEVRWFTLDEIKQLMQEHPDQVSDGLAEVVERYYVAHDPSAYEPVVVVDDTDKVISEASLDDARRMGVIYRVVFVVARNSKGAVLLQKRGPDMRVYPNCWDVTAAGHVDGGRSYEAAARLELAEELGIHEATLTEVAHVYTATPLWDDLPARRYAKIFQTSLPDDVRLNIDGHEVIETRWYMPQELDRLFGESPELLAEGILLARKEGLV
jgi:isopentenyl-diphosphate Delta-isomerase